MKRKTIVVAGIFIISVLVMLFWVFKNKADLPAHRGMVLGLFSKDKNYSYLEDLKGIREFGTSDVLLTVSWYQRDIRSNEIIPREYDGNDIFTLPDAKLEEVIEQAHELGLKAVVFPILRLEKREGKEWRGTIDPTDRAEWWKSYERFILHYAEIAEKKHAAAFSIGSELLSMEKDTESWVKLIEKVRSVYRGELIYSANWDHYQVPAFWGKLDFIGMTAYHELSKSKTPTFEELLIKWQKIRDEIVSWKNQKYPEKKLIFTEIGYHSIDGTAQYPWNYLLEGKIDLEEQDLCYHAFIEAWRHEKALSGVYFWVWWGKGGDDKENAYTPRNKPAGIRLKEWWKPGWF